LKGKNQNIHTIYSLHSNIVIYIVIEILNDLSGCKILAILPSLTRVLHEAFGISLAFPHHFLLCHNHSATAPNAFSCAAVPHPQLGAVALYFTYTAMEEEIERNKEHPCIAPLYFPQELHRRPALGRDLEYFYGPAWQSEVRCSPATRRYVDRIRHVGREEPALLVAHAYTRYMGDLSGGQVLGKVAQRALKLPPTGEGLEFYRFDEVHSAKAFKQLYRSRMNELELDAHGKQKIVAEAVKAFQFNMEVGLVRSLVVVAVAVEVVMVVEVAVGVVRLASMVRLACQVSCLAFWVLKIIRDINGKWIAFIWHFYPKALYSCLTFTNPYTGSGANHAR